MKSDLSLQSSSPSNFQLSPIESQPHVTPYSSVATCLLTRDPYQVRSGRTAVLRTAIDALANRFERVNCIVFENSRREAGHDEKPANCVLRYLGSPSVTRSILGKLVDLARGNALNEIAFHDNRISEHLKESVHDDSRFLYCDSLRLAQYAHSLETPWILDLDDLLSTRFAQFASSDEIEVTQVLGHFGARVPAPLRFLLGLGLRPLMKWESSRLTHREAFWASKANAVSLVSRTEAESFQQRADRVIHALPMSVPDADPGSTWPIKPWKPGETLRAVFVGYLAYQPNLEAIKFMAERAIPFLRDQGTDLEVSVVGSVNGIDVPESVASCPQITMRGFVQDLDAEFDTHHFFAAPIFTGTGVKTKVLEAMRYGIPVVGTPLAFSGMDLSRNDRLEWQTPSSLAKELKRIRDAKEVGRISTESRSYVDRNFSDSVVRHRWNRVIDQLAEGKSAIDTL